MIKYRLSESRIKRSDFTLKIGIKRMFCIDHVWCKFSSWIISCVFLSVDRAKPQYSWPTKKATTETQWEGGESEVRALSPMQFSRLFGGKMITNKILYFYCKIPNDFAPELHYIAHKYWLIRLLFLRNVKVPIARN